MDREATIVELVLDEQRYGLALHSVERVIRRVAVTPLPEAPEIVLGVINVRGVVLPVVDLRRRLRLPDRDPMLSDQIVIAASRRRKLALIVDSVRGVESFARDAYVEAGAIAPRTGYFAGLIKRDDGLILIHDLDAFLSLEEEERLTNALADERARSERSSGGAA